LVIEKLKIEATAIEVRISVRNGYFFIELDSVRLVNTLEMESFLLVVEACESVSLWILSKLSSSLTLVVSY